MATFLVAGATLGLWAGVSPGPMLALVVTQTLRHGAGEGMKVAVAPILTDLPIIVAFLYLVTRLPHEELFVGGLSLAGGVLVAWLGVGALRQGPVELNLDRSPPRSLVKGVLVNAMNPHPYVFWLTVGVPTMLKAHETGVGAAVAFGVAFFAVIIGAKMGVALVVSQSRAFLRGAAYVWSMRLIGAAMQVFAAILIVDGFDALRVAFM